MFELVFSIRSVRTRCGWHLATKANKKTDVAEHPKVSSHVGLLLNKPPGEPGCSLFSHPTTSTQHFSSSAPHRTSVPLTTAFYSAGPGTQG
jgi:hypothetical protein